MQNEVITTQVGPPSTSPSTRTMARVGRRSSDSAQPKIELRKNGDVIESIVVTCACGQTITVDCSYTEGPS